MPDLLLELFSEEIPARMQGNAARELARMAAERLAAAGLSPETLEAFAGPRRLTLHVTGLPAAQADRAEEIKGPRANAPPQSLEGFLRKTGLTREQLSEREGVLYARLDRPGRLTAEIVAEMVPAIVRAFPWPKSMTWAGGTLRWVRPLKRILCLFDGAVVPFDIDGIASGELTEGHRFMGPEPGKPFSVTGFDAYRAELERRFVVLDAAERKRRIAEGARAACADRGLELVEDEGLLEEVAGLAEWPVPILGDMDPAFLDLPPEVVRTSMRTHQKYFAVRAARAPGGDMETETPETSGQDGRQLAPHFVVVANIEARDGGAALAAGNARVLSARLNDARFFWDEDRKPGALDRWLEKLKGVTFHAKLGTMYERVERIEALAREIAPLVGADPALAALAARLCKADLASAMVGEFPELQGLMGGYYARSAPLSLEGRGVGGEGASTAGATEGGSGSHEDIGGHGGAATATSSGDDGGCTPIPDPSPLEGEGRELVADAVRDHYKPLGPSDSVPTAPVTVAVALADKLDTLVGFFAIDERPTGSKDPYALRRAALGVIRLISAQSARIPMRELAEFGANQLVRSQLGSILVALYKWHDRIRVEDIADGEKLSSLLATVLFGEVQFLSLRGGGDRLPNTESFGGLTFVTEPWTLRTGNDDVRALLAFLADRLKVLLREEGKRHDLVDAVFALGDDDLVRITRRVEALDGFLRTEDGAALLAGYKRAANILRAEEKKAPGEAELYRLNPELRDDALPEEAALYAALRRVQGEVDTALAAEDFTEAMRKLAHLRAPVDAFFDRVLVNDPDPEVRLTRLRLLSQVRDTANRVADFSLISG